MCAESEWDLVRYRYTGAFSCTVFMVVVVLSTIEDENKASRRQIALQLQPTRPPCSCLGPDYGESFHRSISACTVGLISPMPQRHAHTTYVYNIPLEVCHYQSVLRTTRCYIRRFILGHFHHADPIPACGGPATSPALHMTSPVQEIIPSVEIPMISWDHQRHPLER